MKAKVLSLAVMAGVVPWTTSAQAAGERFMNGRSIYGGPAAAGPSSTTVDVKQATWLNVRCGDVVTFSNSGQTFTWKFEPASYRAVDLQRIAPPGFG